MAVMFVLALCTGMAAAATGSIPVRVLIRDLASVEGVRSNPLLGYGLVVGLNGTGDRRQTVFTTQALAGLLTRLGVQIPAAAVRVNNVASVFVTASLPPFARPGTPLDVTVSSIGDAKSLEGGILMLTPLRAADGDIYAAAQGPLTIGGYSAGGSGNGKQVNHPTVGRIPDGALVEREVEMSWQNPALSPAKKEDPSAQGVSRPGSSQRDPSKITLLLANESFSTAQEMAAVVNQEFGTPLATAVDSRRVDVQMPTDKETSLPALIARIEKLPVTVERRARVVVNERTGTIVMGRDVQLRSVSILHGSLSVEIATQLAVSQPAPLGQGTTTVTPETKLKASEGPARRVELGEGATVEQLVNGLQAIGASARDVIAILQALKAAGAMEAELDIL
jgi:flagellar P-ring protein precursor FlgI